MNFPTKFIAKVILNGTALYVAQIYFTGFHITGGATALLAGALVLAILNSFIRPVLALISTPLIWLTLGLFHFVIHIIILWIADAILIQLTIDNIGTLFWVSIIIAIANALF